MKKMKKTTIFIILISFIVILLVSLYFFNSFSNKKNQVRLSLEDHLYENMDYSKDDIKSIDINNAMFGFHAVVIFNDESDIAYTYMYRPENKTVYQHSVNKTNGDDASDTELKHLEEEPK